DYLYVKQKVWDYVYARAGKIDFDVMQLGSIIKGQGKYNASINLLNNDLTLNGMMPISLSDSQSVTIYPRGGQIVMHKNRDFDFAGLVHMPRFDFYGKSYSFIYDDFKLSMPIIDSLVLRVPSFTKDKFGRKPLKRVMTAISNMGGDLFIDRSDNKSGRIDTLQQYPIFRSKKPSFTYYDKKNIRRGVYDRENFHFKLDTFSIDSLNDFKTENLAFKGTFVANGVLPELKQDLILMSDYSLGIITDTPEDGYPLYNGKANTSGRIRMSNNGLTSDGDMKYIESTTISKEFVLMPDSTVAQHTESFVNKEMAGDPQYPNVEATDVYMKYQPMEDFMTVRKKEDKIKMFEDVLLDGSFILNREELFGNGRIDFNMCIMISNRFNFKHHEIFSDTCNFKLSAQDFTVGDDASFFSENVNAIVNFDLMESRFFSNGGGTYFHFPPNQYKCFMDRFIWYMDKQELELSKNELQSEMKQKDIGFEKPAFVSEHPDQDSLRFDAPRANWSLKDVVIRAREVDHIDAADSRIFPDSGRVNIFPRAVIETLKNSKVLTNRTNKYHKFYKANIDITGRKNFKGDGFYDYVDKDNKKQQIFFHTIRQDSSKQTYAEGVVFDTADFKLSPAFGYHGKVNLEANDKSLYFDGSFKIFSSCDSLSQTWIDFRSEIDPKSIYIPISKTPVDSGGRPLSVGLNLTRDSTFAYSSFLTKPYKKDDISVIAADGFIFFDKNSKEYRVSSQEKLNFPSTPGNLVSLKNNRCYVYHEGKMDLGANLGALKVDVAGNTTHNLETNEIKLDLMMVFKFFFNDNSLKVFTDDLLEDEELNLVNFERPVYEKALREFNGKEKGDKLIGEISLDGFFKRVPDALNHQIVLNDIKLDWSDETQSYKSKGQIGIGNIGRKQINRMVNGKLMFEKRKSGKDDRMHFYVELTSGNWYYFFYRRGLLQTISNNLEYNKIIKEMKPEDRKLKTKRNEDSFSYTTCSARLKDEFLEDF
ncbi:MAG: hypothetical protein IH948_05795, partial [Bacteroidetes bacterium]|nr:hypothetical protein [Bacteroidota bacterium]